jgi:hypothetical protein
MTTETEPHHRIRTPTAVPNVAHELRRLMPRDRWLIQRLGEHQVFTTEQITALCFDSIDTARKRLSLLASREILDRFREAVRPGSQAWRWTLGWVGAAWLAARDDKPPPRRATITDRTNRLAANQRLAHLLGVNGFFVHLAAHQREHLEAELADWWPEKTCAEITGTLARPDGHGTWTVHGATLRFWLEYDRGTEPTHKLVARLDGYLGVQHATGQRRAVLIRMQTPRQERSLHTHLARHPAVTSGELLVATMSGPDTTNPAGNVWQTTTSTTRLRLHDLVRPADRLTGNNPTESTK